MKKIIIASIISMSTGLACAASMNMNITSVSPFQGVFTGLGIGAAAYLIKVNDDFPGLSESSTKGVRWLCC